LTHEILLEEPNEFSTTASFKWLAGSRLRLDASYYTKDVFRARKALEGFPQQRIDQLTQRVFNLTRFKRVYARPDSGVPYLSASEAMFFRPSSERYLSKSKTENINQYLVQKGWALLTCSGTVGRIAYVGERLSRFAVTHDLIRIVPKDEQTQIGYLCAYLSSWIGQALLTKDQYGSAVKHLESQHINPIPVPLISKENREKIDAQVLKAYEFREKANSLLDKAQILLHNELGAPLISAEEFSSDETTTFGIMVSQLNFRFDASYHNPLAGKIRNLLAKKEDGKAKLGDKCHIFLPDRFRRIYVDQSHGIPFLQPTHLVEIKPYSLKFISRTKTRDIDKLVVRKKWAVLARSGTVGRIVPITTEFEGWCGSDDLLRIIPKDEEMDIGYIVAFLMSPYGVYQTVRETYGGVIGHIEGDHLKEVLIPCLSSTLRTQIGNLVLEAFELKAEANRIEQEAITLLEKELTQQT